MANHLSTDKTKCRQDPSDFLEDVLSLIPKKVSATRDKRVRPDDEEVRRANEHLEKCAASGEPHTRTPVFEVVAGGGQGTFYAQQIRALNLAWALLRSGFLRGRYKSQERGGADNSPSRVAVIGAGLAGLTTAAALARHGCTVSIYDASRHIMHLQRGNGSRFLHPNIYDWPDEGSQLNHTDLPFLNWHEGSAGAVVNHIERQWRWLASEYGITQHLGSRVTGIARGATGRLRVSSTGSVKAAEDVDCVVLCTGFGIEKRLNRLAERSYWRDDSLHQEILEPPIPRKFFVSGIGDGGITDVLRLRIADFDHANFIHHLVATASLNPRDIRAQLVRIDDQARQALKRGVTDVSKLLKDLYDTMELPYELKSYFHDRLRHDTKVTLNGGDALPLSMRAQSFTRFAIYLLLRAEDDGLQYFQGEIDLDKDIKVAKNGKGYLVHAPNVLRTPDKVFFDYVIIRHGVEKPPSLHAFAEKSVKPQITYAHKKPKALWKKEGEQDYQISGYSPADPLLNAIVPSPWNTASFEEIVSRHYVTFFGKYDPAFGDIGTSLKYDVRFLAQPAPEEAWTGIEAVGKYERHPFQHPMFFVGHKQFAYPDSVIFASTVTKKRRFMRHDFYDLWLIINENLEEEDIRVALEQDHVIHREVLSINSKSRTNVHGMDRAFADLAKRLAAYLELQQCDERYPKLVCASIDGIALDIISVKFRYPTPVIVVTFAFPSSTKLAGDTPHRDEEGAEGDGQVGKWSWSPEMDHTLACTSWGLQMRDRAFPFFISGQTKEVEGSLRNELATGARGVQTRGFDIASLSVGQSASVFKAEREHQNAAAEKILQETGVDVKVRGNVAKLIHSTGDKNASQAIISFMVR
jgi:hypothetical protein